MYFFLHKQLIFDDNIILEPFLNLKETLKSVVRLRI